MTATADRVIRCAHQVITHLDADRHLEHDTSRSITTGRQASGKVSLPTADTPKPGRVSAEEAEEALRAAVSFYQDQLAHDDQARAFLKERGVNDESVGRWQLGYAPASWDRLVKALRSERVSDGILLEVGLAGRGRTGRLYDRMRGRIVFPIHDAQGSPSGFAGRLITGDGPKYLNSPETLLYKKSLLLYGLHLAQPSIAEHQQAVIVEGYTDAIAAHQVGITHTVATGGTALTNHQLESIRSIAPTIILAFDGDQAGQQAAERVADLPMTTLQRLHVQLAHLPAGTDPAGLIAEGRADDFQAALTNPTPLLHHLIEQTLDQYDLNEIEATARALHAASPLIEHLTGPTERSTVVRWLARRLDRQEDHIEQ
ncbi:MAG: toprim domain-containing protein, partial [Acidimicrobiia bacterium]